MHNKRLLNDRKQWRYGVLFTIFLLLMLPVSQVFAVTPIAVDDTYTMDANTTLTVAAGPNSLIANDTGFAAATHLITAYDSITRFGGTAVVNGGNGSFSYIPPAGFTGTDVFTYEVETDEGAARATVSIEVVGPVTWFVDDDATPGGNGTYASPFQSLAPLNNNATDVDDPGDRIYVYSGNYTTGITLEDNQELIGQGIAFSLPNSGISITADTRPSIEALGALITVSDDNIIRGVSLLSNSGEAILANAITDLTVQDSLITLTSANAFTFTDVNGTVNIERTSITGASPNLEGAVELNGGAAVIAFINDGDLINIDGGYAVNVFNAFAGELSFDSTSTINTVGGLVQRQD